MSQENVNPTQVMPRFDEYVQTIRELWDASNRGDVVEALARAHAEIEMQDLESLPLR